MIYAVTVTLNHEEIGKKSQRLLEKDGWKQFEKNKVIITVSMLYVKETKIFPDCDSKHNAKCKKQVTFHDSKQRRTTSYSSKKTISIIKRNIVKT